MTGGNSLSFFSICKRPNSPFAGIKCKNNRPQEEAQHQNKFCGNSLEIIISIPHNVVYISSIIICQLNNVAFYVLDTGQFRIETMNKYPFLKKKSGIFF